MRFAYSLGLGLALAGAAGAQTTATPGNPQPETGKRIPADQAAIALPPALYQMGDVGKSLQLTQDQINRLNGVTQKMQTQYAPQLEKLGTLSEAERFARIQELNRLYSADWYKSASDIFNDQQRTRYQQLTQQFGGFSTLYDPEVQKRLNLTPEQVRNLRANVEWSNQQFGTINTLGATDASKGTQQYERYMKEREERFTKFLTPEQLKTWREMTGDPYTFQPTFTPKR
jgi:hypothetical protein